MPILIILKNPAVTLAAKGKFTEKYVRDISKLFGRMLRQKAVDDMDMLIPIQTDSNIAYIKEISDEQYNEMKEEKERRRTQPSPIVRPNIKMAPPGRKFRRGN